MCSYCSFPCSLIFRTFCALKAKFLYKFYDAHTITVRTFIYLAYMCVCIGKVLQKISPPLSFSYARSQLPSSTTLTSPFVGRRYYLRSLSCVRQLLCNIDVWFSYFIIFYSLNLCKWIVEYLLVNQQKNLYGPPVCYSPYFVTNGCCHDQWMSITA